MLAVSIKTDVLAAEMKIHAINLSRGNVTFEGDAVLIQSGEKNLLMDTGCEYTSPTVVQYLKNHGVRELDLYISHFHTHTKYHYTTFD